MANLDILNSPNRLKERKILQNSGEEDFGSLHDSIIGSAGPRISPSIKMRRDSYPEHTPAFSPSEGAWSGFHFSIENGTADSSGTSQHFLQPPQNSTLGSSQGGRSAWALSRPSGSCTPTPGFEQIVDFGGSASSVFEQQPLHSHQPPFEVLASGTTHSFNPHTGFPTSPQSSRSGWASASPPEGADSRNIPQSTAPSSPTLAGTTQVLRRDGIRKKNARFEIPAERNLRTIDQLINQTSDEQEIKELKQQKRLLRNRQAALDSRQRKKQHTERLEEEKKHYTSVISELEEALGEIKLQEAEWMREKESYALAQQQYQRYIDSMVMEKEDIVRRHTIETGELRKKNAILMEQLQRLEGTAMSTAPSSTGFSADFSDFDQLTMNSWDDFSMANDFSIEVDPRTDGSLVGTTRKDPPREGANAGSDDDKAVSSGLLLMLLLCGAWVASQSSTSSGPLPTMSDELRSASATVLDNIYKDSGIQIHGGNFLGQNYPTAPGADTLQTIKSPHNSYEFAGPSSSSLETLHQRLTSPSEQQLREQEFSLTPVQYNDLSAMGISHPLPSHEARNCRTIGQVLASTSIPGERVAETYTRSLMKDRVSAQVLQDFARMVTQSSLGNQNHWKTEPLD